MEHYSDKVPHYTLGWAAQARWPPLKKRAYFPWGVDIYASSAKCPCEWGFGKDCIRPCKQIRLRRKKPPRVLLQQS